eukprot:6212347-Pleurochrysis_carterae.AAC.3
MPRYYDYTDMLGELKKSFIDRPLQQHTLMEGYVGYPPRPDRMHPIGSYVLRGAGCHECEDHDQYGFAPYYDAVLQTMFIVVSLHYRPGRILTSGCAIMYMWGHPVATLPSDEGDNTSLLQNDITSANHRGRTRPRVPCARYRSPCA